MYLFEQAGNRFVPTGITRGPWSPDAMNGGAVAALCARGAERHHDNDAPRSEDQVLARLTIDLVRPAPLVPLTVQTSTVRRGRKVQLVSVEMATDDEVVCRASALRMRTADLPLPRRAEDPPPPFLDEADVVDPDVTGEQFHTHALEMRRLGGERPVIVWARMTCQVVAGEEPSSQQRAAAIADLGSGSSSIVPFTEWTFLNVDVDLHLHRRPEGEWLGMKCTTQASSEGIGLAISEMSDRRGRCGQVEQAVLLERR